MKWILVIGLLFASACKSLALEEGYYVVEAQKRLGGNIEVTLEDLTRVDLLTATHAWELEYAWNWQEGIGQSLHYALLTNLTAGIILIVEHEREWKFVEALEGLIEAYELPVDVEVIDVSRPSVRIVDETLCLPRMSGSPLCRDHHYAICDDSPVHRRVVVVKDREIEDSIVATAIGDPSRVSAVRIQAGAREVMSLLYDFLLFPVALIGFDFSRLGGLGGAYCLLPCTYR